MDAQTFLANFATIAAAPGGVDRLRELILDLAISGRLVEQRPTEVPVSLGLAEVRAEKGAVLNAKVKGRSKVPREPESWEVASDTPTGWCWARIDDTGEYVNGLAFKQGDWQDDGLPIIRIQNLTNPNAEFNYARGSFPEDRTVDDGDILVSWSATLEAFVWDRGPAVVNQHIFKVIPEMRVVAPGFLYHLLRHTIRDLADSDAAHGLAMKHINRGPFVSHVVGIPPLAEQERIVSKVDELMELCDDLVARQQARQHVTTRLRASSLDALTNAETDDDLHTAWSRIHANWEALTDRPDSIDTLRQTILDLAIQGLLTDRHDSDGTGTDTFEIVTRAKDDLFETRAIRRHERSLPVSKEEEPFLVPPGWRWCRFDELCSQITVGHVGPMASRYKDNGVPFLRSQNVGEFRFEPAGLKFVDQGFHAELSKSALKGGEILAVRSGNVGRTCVFPAGIGEANCADLVVMRPLPGIDPHYLAIVMNSPYGAAHVLDQKVGIAQGHFNVKSARQMPTPLPPTAEQERISDRVRVLRELCGGLEARLLERDASASAYCRAMTSRGVA